MNTTFLRRSTSAGNLCIAFLAVTAPAGLYGADVLTWEQKEQFLLKAKQVGNPKTAKKGVTETSTITLTDGKITHDASACRRSMNIAPGIWPQRDELQGQLQVLRCSMEGSTAAGDRRHGPAFRGAQI